MNYKLSRHIFNKKIFKMYDIRGLYKEELNEDDAYFIGLHFGSIVKKKFGKKKICVCYDARKESFLIKKSLIEGLINSGSDVVDCNLATSPILSYCAMMNDGFGIMITASHNPIGYTGFKITFDNKPFFNDDLLQIYNMSLTLLDKSKEKGSIFVESFYEKYVEEIFKNIKINQEQFKLNIAIDSLNGSTLKILNLIQNYNKIKFDLINTKHIEKKEVSPDPTKEENLFFLKEKIQRDENLNIGFVFDGDGDRIVVLDKNGKTIPIDHILIIFIRNVLKGNKNKKIAFDVKCSKILEKEILKNGGIPVISKTGHSFLKELMNNDSDIIFACEGSGHIYFSDKYFGFDDAIYAFLRLIEIMNAQEISDINLLTEDIEKTIKKSDIKIYTDKKELIMQKIITHFDSENNENIKKILLIDGIKIEMKNDSWILIRQSNTEECVSLSYEAFNIDDFKKIEEFYIYINGKFFL